MDNSNKNKKQVNSIILQSIDYFFILFHSALILFNVFGWIIPKWRFANLISLSVTAFSWFVLGIWYGIGYCPFTDWHWKVRQLLDYNDETPMTIIIDTQENGYRRSIIQ